MLRAQWEVLRELYAAGVKEAKSQIIPCLEHCLFKTEGDNQFGWTRYKILTETLDQVESSDSQITKLVETLSH